MRYILNFLLCTVLTQQNNNKVRLFVRVLPTYQSGWPDMSQFLLLELSHVCTFRIDRTGRPF